MTTAPPPLSFLRRHARVWLDAARVAALSDADALVVRHVRRGLPFVMRRVLQDDPPACVPLALRLAPGDGRRGLAFAVSRSMVMRAAPPLSLAEALRQTALPSAWHASLTALDAALVDVGVTAHVYGSLAWQCMTGDPYLHDGSDIDLLLHPASIAQMRNCLRTLQAFAGDLPLDGEIELPDGRALAWKELAGDTRDTRYVLVKSAHGVALTERRTLWDPRHWN